MGLVEKVMDLERWGNINIIKNINRSGNLQFWVWNKFGKGLEFGWPKVVGTLKFSND